MQKLYYVVQNNISDEFVSGGVKSDKPLRRAKKLEKADRFTNLKDAKFCIFYLGLIKSEWRPVLVCETEGRIYVK